MTPLPFRSLFAVVLAASLGCNSPKQGSVALPGAPGAAPPAVPATASQDAPQPKIEGTTPPAPATGQAPQPAVVEVVPRDISAFVQNGIQWLVRAQHPSGGWGAGSHASQQIRDPATVKTDPATTAFTAMALIRAGHTPVSGEHRQAVRLATEHLCGVVEEAPEEGPRITDLQGTQPQAKLGDLVDTAMTIHFLARALRALPEDEPLRKRVDLALDKCLRKLQGSQASDGSWGKAGGWAPVLQSALSCTALEVASAAGKQINPEALERARYYQKGNFNAATGRAASAEAAGVELYAFASSQRASAKEAEEASQLIRLARSEGKLAADAPVNATTLALAAGGGGLRGLSAAKAESLADAFGQREAQLRRLDDESLLAGFGNNGGEEYLSYLFTSESLVISGGEPWEKWNEKMHARLSKVQSPDGSWTGHHCITSPVFCTAAVVQCLTTDREAAFLREVGAHEVASAKGTSAKVK